MNRRFRDSQFWKWRVVVLVGLVVIAGTVVGGIAWAQQASTPVGLEPVISSLPPDATPPETPIVTPSYTQEDLQAALDRVRGPKTAGTTLAIKTPDGTNELKLPPDVYIANQASYVLGCFPDYCLRTPAYTLARGNSRVVVDSAGYVVGETIYPGEEGAFDWLYQILQTKPHGWTAEGRWE